MRYKYFSPELLESNIDLNQVFPDKQEMAKQRNAVSYGFLDIVLYLKEQTDNFSKQENQWIDLDNAIYKIVDNWYRFKGEPNPFLKAVPSAILQGFIEGKVPKEAVVIKDGTAKGKGIVKPSEVLTSEEIEEIEEIAKRKAKIKGIAAAIAPAPIVAVAPIAPMGTPAPTGTPEEILTQRIEELKANLNRKKKFLILADDDEKREFMENFMRKLIYQEEDAIEELENAKNENRQPNPFLIEKVKILKDFANVNK